MEQSERYKQSLLKSIEREWQALWYVVEQLSPGQMLTPDAGGWTPKDNLAHLTRWMQALREYHLDGRSTAEVWGLPAEIAENFDFNTANAWLTEQDRPLSGEKVLADLKTEYAAVMARLAAMPLEDLMKPHYEDDPERRPLVLWVMGNTSEHFLEHRDVIERILK